MPVSYKSTCVSTFCGDELAIISVQYSGLVLSSLSLCHILGTHCSGDQLKTLECPIPSAPYLLRATSPAAQRQRCKVPSSPECGEDRVGVWSPVVYVCSRVTCPSCLDTNQLTFPLDLCSLLSKHCSSPH